jgi:hypothetical protein
MPIFLMKRIEWQSRAREKDLKSKITWNTQGGAHWRVPELRDFACPICMSSCPTFLLEVVFIGNETRFYLLTQRNPDRRPETKPVRLLMIKASSRITASAGLLSPCPLTQQTTWSREQAYGVGKTAILLRLENAKPKLLSVGPWDFLDIDVHLLRVRICNSQSWTWKYCTKLMH